LIAPTFRRDRFGIYWVEESTGVVYCESEKQWLLQKYQAHLAGKEILESVPTRKVVEARKFFNSAKKI